MPRVVPASRLEWGQSTEQETNPSPPEIFMLAVHDANTMDSQIDQHKVGTLVNQGRYIAHTEYLDQPPETSLPPGPEGPQWKVT